MTTDLCRDCGAYWDCGHAAERYAREKVPGLALDDRRDPTLNLVETVEEDARYGIISHEEFFERLLSNLP